MKTIFMAVVVLLFIGCSTLGPNEQWETMLNMVKTPITVVSVSSTTPRHVMFVDAKGRYFSVIGNHLQSLQVGDILY